MDDVSPPGRSVDIELGGQEVITIELDNLDPNPDDVLDLLKDGQCTVYVWTKLAGEYWRRGYLEAAERIATTAIEWSLPPIYALLANLQIAYARKAPKLILEEAQQDIMTSEKPKDDYYREAALYLNTGEKVGSESGEGVSGTLAFLTRGIQQLATRSMDDAMRSFEGVLAEKPTNLVALLGKARILYARRNYKEALRLFQDVLRYNPTCIPDPRIGIGLCFWAMDQKSHAKAAWERSLELNPSEGAAQLLLGIESINASKNPKLPESQKAKSFVAGTKLIEKSFQSNNRSAAAANALCELFLRKGNLPRALKLAERTIQFADTLTILTEGYLRAGRVSHASGSLSRATKFYNAAIEGQPNHIIGAIGMAQMQILNDEMAAAIHTLDTLIQPPNPQRSLEATVMLASLRAYPRPGVSSADLAQEKTRARELFDRVSKTLELEDAGANGALLSKTSRGIAEDIEMHAEIARLWQDENLDRMGKALKEALRISQSSEDIDPRLVNNIGVLHHLEGQLVEAQRMYENALTTAASMNSDAAEGLSTTVLYNLARVYEDSGQDKLATDAYEKLLSRHPEYIDAKIRQAQMLTNINRVNDAHELIKQALVSQSNNLNLRAYYTYFLIHSNSLKTAKDFIFSTLRDQDKHDVYSFCAVAWIHYNQARENRDTTTKGIEERKKNFQRSAEFYEKALQYDPTCAFAAQGLAIITAEDALGSMGGALARVSAYDEAQQRLQNAREALDVFAKVRESINDGSVYLNIGHCYYARDEFDRAIESYETASTRFYNGQNVPTLLCLCRSWYAKAMKDQSYVAMKTALKYAEAALHIHPNDKANVYNVAMIQQKSAELLFSINVAKRTLKDLQKAIDSATHAQKIFASLAADKSAAVPYDRDIADNRRKYGDGMLRKAEEHLKNQRQHEMETRSKIEAARQRRQEEKERQDALERERAEKLRIEAEKLAEERRLAREQALEWTREVRMESDEERERKVTKKKKPKAEIISGDEAEPKAPKKRRGKLKKASSDHDHEGDVDQTMFSEDEDIEKPAKKRIAKKRVVRDEDEEDDASRPKKQFKSKAMISDSDDEMS
ncbi:Tetratricopeptide repeat protein 1 [Psilocybe cubensis]|uniref:Tetratricopeptide repeat protein 1 n=1 Tax=Psilocybe cubensis TaxID=181762 RepID=A0ACB8HBD6_PSICU|nr:Tetratricopeptide repeat protein 1 [Psilocybe cubensis]KAH9484994.1 Tetratricopeptide repeat protein 1 [Psilocybe cubensis]